MKKILILDDNELLVEQFTYIFEDYAIIPSASIHEAQKIIDSDPDLDLIILDENLPDGHGSSLIPQIRAKYPDIYIIILTGYTGHEIPAAWNDQKIMIKFKDLKIIGLIDTIRELVEK